MEASKALLLIPNGSVSLLTFSQDFKFLDTSILSGSTLTETFP
jgi:hypothetical protein